jgi:hypothetical protein
MTSSQQSIRVGRAEVVVPSAQVPPEVRPLRANNNLDACRVGPVTYLAWRTAPIHFASPRARLEVVAIDADGGWTHETTVALGRDVREPRLVLHDDRLRLYFFTAGRHPLRFEPDRIQMMERLGPGEWQGPTPVSPPDHVVWRVRSLDGRLVMSCYGDASGAYTTDRSPRAELWFSEDGTDWDTWFDSEALVPGTTETDFVALDDGALLIASRLESRGSGLGTQLAVIGAGGAVRRSRHEPRKFDSPALFNWHGRTYIVTRRQRAFGGRVEVLPQVVPAGARDIGDQFLYWATPKATALYEIDRTTLEVQHVADLPGCGDTAFAAVVGEELDDSVTVFNYSSPLGWTALPWVAGQLLPTQIHRVCLERSPAPSDGDRPPN